MHWIICYVAYILFVNRFFKVSSSFTNILLGTTVTIYLICACFRIIVLMNILVLIVSFVLDIVVTNVILKLNTLFWTGDDTELIDNILCLFLSNLLLFQIIDFVYFSFSIMCEIIKILQVFNRISIYISFSCKRWLLQFFITL